VEILAEGFSGNLIGRNVGRYHGKFQEPIPGFIQAAFQSNRIKEIHSPAKFRFAYLTNISRLKKPFAGCFRFLLIDFFIPALREFFLCNEP
jgi:hypothetical protein